MKFQDLADIRSVKQKSKFRIILSEHQLKRIIDKLLEEQIENKIIEHKTIKSK